MKDIYSPQHRAVQEGFDMQRLADRLNYVIVTAEIAAELPFSRFLPPKVDRFVN